MSAARLIELGLAPRLTNQELASMALSEDQARRDAERRGDRAAAANHGEEAERLAALLQ